MIEPTERESSAPTSNVAAKNNQEKKVKNESKVLGLSRDDVRNNGDHEPSIVECEALKTPASNYRARKHQRESELDPRSK